MGLEWALQARHHCSAMQPWHLLGGVLWVQDHRGHCSEHDTVRRVLIVAFSGHK